MSNPNDPSDPMNERLDRLLSAAIDDELDAREREELEELMTSDLGASARRSQFESADEALRGLAMASADAQAPALESGLAAIRARLDEPVVRDELAARRRRMPRWVPATMTAAAAAVVIFAVLPTTQAPRVDDSIELTSVFGLDGDLEDGASLDGLSLEDFEIIEELELMEFLAARDGEGRG